MGCPFTEFHPFNNSFCFEMVVFRFNSLLKSIGDRTSLARASSSFGRASGFISSLAVIPLTVSEAWFENVRVILDNCAQLGSHALSEVYLQYLSVVDFCPVESYSRQPVSSKKGWTTGGHFVCACINMSC